MKYGNFGKKTISKRIKRLRQIRGLTQMYVSKTISVPQPSLADYEIGRIRVPLEIVLKLCNLYKINIDKIIGKRGRR